jgi:hypothetical protein
LLAGQTDENRESQARQAAMNILTELKKKLL